MLLTCQIFLKVLISCISIILEANIFLFSGSKNYCSFVPPSCFALLAVYLSFKDLGRGDLMKYYPKWRLLFRTLLYGFKTLFSSWTINQSLMLRLMFFCCRSEYLPIPSRQLMVSTAISEYIKFCKAMALPLLCNILLRNH